MPAPAFTPATTTSSLATRYSRALVMPEVAVRLPAVTVMESGITRVPVGRVSGERMYESEHFFFWMTVIENLPEYTFQRALDYADPDNVEELAQLAARLRLESVEPGNWYPTEKDATALFSRSGEFKGVQVAGQSTMDTTEGAKCTAIIWFTPDTLEKMSLALLATAYRDANEQGYKPISAEIAEIVLSTTRQVGRFTGSATFMPDTSYGLAGLLEARHALRTGSMLVPDSTLAELDDLISTHGERYREYLGGRDAYGLDVRV
ncbi:hypothetical protein [Candidatus Poriferisocius sp.]|uniref:hypothetical protein n=1 Tax=Candidatus Poriferisocius sp. TaxID=3101276 RepID=UPI003B02A0FF